LLDYATFRPLLFRLDPEVAHTVVEKSLAFTQYLPDLLNPLKVPSYTHDALRQEFFGCTFLNPVGLAAGLDKNASMIEAMAGLGFGFTEIGTVTPRPQSGNPKPRLFRHVAQKTLQNAMGFNNDGMEIVASRLSRGTPYSLPVGVNIGKNKLTPQENAIDDYTTLVARLHTFADYLVINISSPNTPNLRDLQNEAFIQALFAQAKKLTTKPILLKIAPDMSHADAIALCTFAVEAGADGIIATNTTIDHALVPNPYDVGGLSGAVLCEKSFALFDTVASALFGKTLLISVGGISSGAEAYRRIRAGASLVQLYSSLIFEGPMLVNRINQELVALLARDGFEHISQAIGIDREVR